MKKPFIFILLLSFSVVIVSVVSSLLLYSDIDETKESVKNKIKKSMLYLSLFDYLSCTISVIAIKR